MYAFGVNCEEIQVVIIHSVALEIDKTSTN